MAINFGPLRQQTIYGQVPMEPSPTMPNQGVIDPMMNVGPELPIGPQAPEEIDTIARMQQLYQPETAMGDRFNQLLDTMPARKRPGKLRKLGASFIALKNPKLAEHFMYAPFEHEMEDWKSRMEPTQAAANLERQENIERRRYAESTVKGEREERKLDETVRSHKEKERISQLRAEVYAAKQNSPDLEFKVSESGMIVGLNPKTGQQVQTGLKSNELSDLDKIQLGIKGRIEVEKAKTTEVVKRTAAQSAARKDELKAKGWELYNGPNGKVIAINPNTREQEEIEGIGGPVTKPTSAGAGAAKKPMTYAQLKTRANQAKINPDWAPWIKIGPREITISPPATETNMFGKKKGPTPEERKRIEKAIFGEITEGEQVIDQGTIPPEKSRNFNLPGINTTPAPGRKAKKPAKPGMLRVIAPDGREGDYPKNKPLPPGFQYAYEE